VGQFLLRAFHWDWDDHRVNSPKRKSQCDTVDAIGETKSDPACGRQTKRPQLRRENNRPLNQISVGKSVVSLNQRHFFGPIAGDLVQQFGQIHIVN
jgi:hypothetical protein